MREEAKKNPTIIRKMRIELEREKIELEKRRKGFISKKDDV